MVATIIRRGTRRLALQDHKREQITTAKTGISVHPTVNEALDEIDAKSQASGTGATSSGIVPRLLKKRRQLQYTPDVSSNRITI